MTKGGRLCYNKAGELRKHERRNPMEPLIKFWLFLCHWVQFETSEEQETIDDIIDTLGHAGLPYKTRTRRGKDGQTEYVLYVKNADRDYARYCTGWRPF